MIKAMRVGMTVVCVINDKMYKKSFTDNDEIQALYEKALNTNHYDNEEIQELISMLVPEKTQAEKEFEKKMEEQDEFNTLVSWMEEIRAKGDDNFEVLGTKLYAKGINISIPEFLALEFNRRRESEEDTNALMNFWRRCALNPDPRCREDLYKFLINTKMTVTPSGYFVAYRNANVKESRSRGDRRLNEFIGAQYAKIKGHKKSPRNFAVYQVDGEYILVHVDKGVRTSGSYLGLLSDLYEYMTNNSESRTVYTDAHSGSTTIIIGQPVKIDRSQCDANPDQTCSRGLHLGSTNFMRRGYFGEVGLVCLCDPMDVVAVPYTDGQKLRTCEYLPIAIAEYDENGMIIPVETETFEYDYAKLDQEELEEMLRNTTLESLKEHHIIPMEISMSAFKQAITGLKDSLDEMTQIVKERTETV